MDKKLKKILLIIILTIFGYNFISQTIDVYNEFTNIDIKKEIEKLSSKELKEQFNVDDYNQITNEQLNDFKNQMIQKSMLPAILFIFGLSIIETIFEVFIKFFYLWIIVIGAIVSNKKILKSKYSKNDFNKYDGYWRELLKDYSVDILSFIDKFKLDNNTITAMLLQLENKNAISFDGNYITKNSLSNSLNSTEQFIFDNIENGKLKKFSMYEYKTKVINEAISSGLLENKLPSKKILTKEIRLSLIIYIIANIIAACLLKSINEINITILIFPFILIILFIFFYVPYKIYYIAILIKKISKETFYRTKKGEEINKRIEGLKNYFKDFTNLSEKNKEELAIWNEYLIYSVLFDQNDEIIEKYKNVIN